MIKLFRFVLLVGGILVLVLGFQGLWETFAQGVYPDDVQVFTLEDGHTCVVWPDGSGDCYCPCEVAPSCPDAKEEVLRGTPTSEEQGTPTPDTPTATPEPPVEKPKCNRGIGNGSENCDPGNSYGQGKGEGRRAGEDREE